MQLFMKQVLPMLAIPTSARGFCFGDAHKENVSVRHARGCIKDVRAGDSRSQQTEDSGLETRNCILEQDRFLYTTGFCITQQACNRAQGCRLHSQSCEYINNYHNTPSASIMPRRSHTHPPQARHNHSILRNTRITDRRFTACVGLSTCARGSPTLRSHSSPT
eukprot:2013279-Rhodomonas_salina.1